MTPLYLLSYAGIESAPMSATEGAGGGLAATAVETTPGRVRAGAEI
jgi:hypothetical protein